MHRNAIAAGGSGEMRLHIGFDVPSGGSVVDVQQIEHEFGDGVGGGEVRRVHVRRVERGRHVVAAAMFGAELVRHPAEFEPMAEEMMDHVHAAGLAMLEDDDGDAGRGHPGHEAFEVRQPLVGGDVIEGVRAEDKIAPGVGPGGQDRLAEGVGGRDGLPELGQQMGVRFDGDRPVEGAGEGAGDFAVARPGIDEHVARGQIIHHPLQPALGVPLLVGVIEEGLKRLLVGLSLGIKDADAFMSGHRGGDPIQPPGESTGDLG